MGVEKKNEWMCRAYVMNKDVCKNGLPHASPSKKDTSEAFCHKYLSTSCIDFDVPTTEDPSAKESDQSLMPLVYSSIGCLVFLALVFGLLIFRKRRMAKKKQGKLPVNWTTGQGTTGGTTGTTGATSVQPRGAETLNAANYYFGAH